jgi:hypothetical protein
MLSRTTVTAFISVMVLLISIQLPGQIHAPFTGPAAGEVVHHPLRPTHLDNITISYSPEPGDNTSVVRLSYSIDDAPTDEVDLFDDKVTGDFTYDLGVHLPGTRISYEIVAWNRTVGSNNITVSSLVEMVWLDDLEEAKELAMVLGMPILVFVSDLTDKHSYEMMQVAFADERVLNLSLEFVTVKVDAYDDPSTTHDLDVKETPTLIFLDNETREVHRVVGPLTGGLIVKHMHFALGRGDLPKKDLNPRFPSFVHYLLIMMAVILMTIFIIFLYVRGYYRRY